MPTDLGRLQTQFFAYVQMRRQQAVRTGQLASDWGITPQQERELLSRLARRSLIARVRRGLYLVPPRFPPGGKWSPSEFLALTTLIEDRGGRYQVCGPSAFHRFGWEEQVPNRLFAYNNRLSGERNIASVAVTLIKLADERLGDTEFARTPEGIDVIYSSRVRSLVDAVYDWRLFNSLPRGYDWIRAELARDPAIAGKIVQTALQYGNVSTVRRLGKLLELEGVKEPVLRKLHRPLKPSTALIPWVPTLPKRELSIGVGEWLSTMYRESRKYHEDEELFLAALSFTQSETGFSARLVEKDYFCSLLLEDLLAAANPQWVFKGGTCLSKVHSDFYRMSEDLDFAFSIAVDAPRSLRSKMIVPMKEHLAGLPRRSPCFHVAEAIRGFNSSSQYVARLYYRSVVSGQDESIKVEFAIREPIVEPVEFLPARTLLLDPFRQASAVPPLNVPALSCRESFAEKLRAALTRREPAIRDLFDIDYGIRSGRVSLGNPRLIELVRRKLSVPRKDDIDVSDRKRKLLGDQVQAQLKAVLRDADFIAFDLDRAFAVTVELVRLLA